MAFPPEFKTKELDDLESKLDEIPFNELLPPSKEALLLIGAYIQLYCFIEFNLRRCIEVFLVSGLISSPKGTLLAPAMLTKVVKAGVAKMDAEVEDISDSLKKLDEIELRRPFRHALAHCAVRRFPNDDALILLTKDDGDTIKQLGAPTAQGGCMNMIFALPDFRGLFLHISEYEAWLAMKTSEWYARYIGANGRD